MISFKNIKLRTKLFLGFGVVGIAIAVMGFIIFNAVVDIQMQNERVKINTTLLGAVNQVKSTVLSDMLNINSIIELKEYDSINKYMDKHIEAQRKYKQNDDLVSAIIQDSLAEFAQTDSILMLINQYQHLHQTNFENYFQPGYDTMMVYMRYYLQVEYNNYTDPVEIARKRQKELKVKRKEPLFICFNSGQKLFAIISNLEEALKTQLNEAQKEISSIIDHTIITTTTLIAITLIVALLVSASLAQLIIKPILRVMEFLNLIAGGVLPDEKLKESSDEIGTMSGQINNHISNLKACTQFAEKIGSGKLSIEFKANDALGLSLIQMQKRLKAVAQEDKKRSFVSSGIEKINQILRSSYDLEVVSDGVVSTVVKLLEAYMGAIFIAETSELKETILNLKASYAYGSKKNLKKELSPGQSLAGQSFIKGETIYLKTLPENYANITSGLGDCQPNYVIIVPLKTDREIVGVLEIAGLKALEDYEISFLEEAASIIGSAVVGIKMSEFNEQISGN